MRLLLSEWLGMSNMQPIVAVEKSRNRFVKLSRRRKFRILNPYIWSSDSGSSPDLASPLRYRVERCRLTV